jgi:hypothetical protein
MNFEIGSEKTVSIKANGQAYSMRVPKLGEQKVLEAKLKAADPAEVYDVYDAFFMGLGLGAKASDLLDAQDFIDLIEFIFNPKKKTVSPQN